MPKKTTSKKDASEMAASKEAASRKDGVGRAVTNRTEVSTVRQRSNASKLDDSATPHGMSNEVSVLTTRRSLAVAHDQTSLTVGDRRSVSRKPCNGRAVCD